MRTMLIRVGTNKTLKGHKLLMITPWERPNDFIEKLSAKFPDLEVRFHQLPDIDFEPVDPLPAEEWKDVTLAFTFKALPKPDEAPKLEYVQLMSAGANHVLHEPVFKDTDVTFCTANGVHGPQISEWIISTYLAFEHRFAEYLGYQQQGRWDRGELMTIEDAASKTIGILGYGSIGRQTARLAKALGMRVHAYTLHPRPTPASRRDTSWSPPGMGDPEGEFPSEWFSGGSTADLHRFLSSGLDLLVVATPLTDRTTHLLGKAEFEVLARAAKRPEGKGRKGGTFVSNIARGAVVDTEALIEALNGELIRGAAIDVTDPEPLPDGHPLWSAKNVIVTPHVSGASVSYYDRVLAVLEVNLERLSEGGELVNVVDKKSGY